MEKYKKDGPFMDPVVRCDSCQSLLLMSELKTAGQCSRCSNTRVRNLRGVLTEGDCQTLIIWRNEGKVDPDFVALFVSEGGEA